MAPSFVHRNANSANAPHDLGTDNVLFDLGFEDAERLTAKTLLAFELNGRINDRRLSSAEVRTLTGLHPAEVDQLRGFRLQDLALERLERTLSSSASVSSPARR